MDFKKAIGFLKGHIAKRIVNHTSRCGIPRLGPQEEGERRVDARRLDANTNPNPVVVPVVVPVIPVIPAVQGFTNENIWINFPKMGGW